MTKFGCVCRVTLWSGNSSRSRAEGPRRGCYSSVVGAMETAPYLGTVRLSGSAMTAVSISAQCVSRTYTVLERITYVTRSA